MDGIWSDISSSRWLFSVVFMALLINLFSAYLKPPLDRFLSRSSQAIRNRLSSEKRGRARRAEALATDFEKMQLALLDEMRHRVVALSWAAGGILFGMMVFALPQIRPTTPRAEYVLIAVFCLAGLATCLMSAMDSMAKAGNIRREILQAGALSRSNSGKVQESK